jgi:hypothetical protein
MSRNKIGKGLLRTSRRLLRHTEFDATGEAVDDINASSVDLGVLVNISGWWRLLPCLAIDTAKFAVYGILAAGFGASGTAVCSLGNMFSGSCDEDVIFGGAMMRSRQLQSLLCADGCQTPVSFRRSFKAGNEYWFLALSLCITVWDSLKAAEDSLYLAYGEILMFADCPPEGQDLFRLLEQLKWLLKDRSPSGGDERAEAMFAWGLVWTAIGSDRGAGAFSDFVILLQEIEDAIRSLSCKCDESVPKGFVESCTNLECGHTFCEECDPAALGG